MSPPVGGSVTSSRLSKIQGVIDDGAAGSAAAWGAAEEDGEQ